MKTRQVILLLLFCSTITLRAQGFSAWFTYNQSSFTYSPGIELCYTFENDWGILTGLNTQLSYPVEEHLVQPFDGKHFEILHNVNLNINRHLLADRVHRLGASFGVKAYFGSKYEIIYYDADNDYSIYSNTDDAFVLFGVDFGLSYSYRKLTFLLKYDTALNKVRLGIGCYFGKYDE